MNKSKIIDSVSLILVGGLFIFSGLIKLNDPIGTAIKLEEYFEVFSSDIASFFHVFVPLALPMAVIFVVLEVALGVAVLFRIRMQLTTLILMLLIVFFTFLTFYSAYFDKVTDCGCFGDAIKLTPWQSFYKDLVLLVLAIYLFVRRKKIFPVFNALIGDVVAISITVLCVFTSIYAIRHLPFALYHLPFSYS